METRDVGIKLVAKHAELVSIGRHLEGGPSSCHAVDVISIRHDWKVEMLPQTGNVTLY